MTPGCGCHAHVDEQNSCAAPIPQAPTRQKDGRKTYKHAITEWEYDLARLKREIYRDARHQFPWPMSEP